MMPQASYNPWGTPMFPNTGSAFGVGSPAEAAERQPTFVDSLLSHIAGALGRGFMAPGQALQSTEPITTEQMLKPAGEMAGMVTLGAGAVPAEANALRMGIKAYHGSPHDFDRFDISKIGTGEGAQAYGHGLYFAESPAVAQGYRDKLELGKGGPGRPAYETPEYSARSILDAVGGDRQRAIAEIEKRREIFSGVDPKYRAAGAEEKFQSVLDILKEGKPLRGGKMYEVNLNADPAHFLDWDKPLSAQPPSVVAALGDKIAKQQARGDVMMPDYLRRFENGELSGSSVYSGLGRGTPESATQEAMKAGIPGIRYLDQGSRSSGQGSSNYVMFDDKLIDILRKYGIAGMTAPPIFANAMSEQKQ